MNMLRFLRGVPVRMGHSSCTLHEFQITDCLNEITQFVLKLCRFYNVILKCTHTTCCALYHLWCAMILVIECEDIHKKTAIKDV